MQPRRLHRDFPARADLWGRHLAWKRWGVGVVKATFCGNDNQEGRTRTNESLILVIMRQRHGPNGRGKNPMSSSGSVTTWIGLLEKGDEDAAQRLWERYFSRLLEFARGRLRGQSTRVLDEEDLALSAFFTFCRAAAGKRVPQVNNRDDLWRTLVLITAGKAIDWRRRQQSLKRGGGRLPANDLPGSRPDDFAMLENVIGAEPDPAFAAQLAEEFQLLMDRLADDRLRELALLKLEGYSNEEIAEKLACSLRTVTRRLTVIRRIWETSEPGAGQAPSDEAGEGKTNTPEIDDGESA